ncbi:MAG TPA: hypothetical protein VJS43_01425 [Candidatus Acidoferrales bacterium]|nr:hypothetical protein [Candidatus Acidoferrales bacterium]
MTRSVWVALPILILLALGSSGTGKAQPPRSTTSQGCVNQGKDRRAFAPVVCWTQRHLSWKSPHKPRFFLLGKTTHTSLGFAWPPYVVYNSPKSKGQWRMFRIGFRYDRNWHGYIFPTAAWKIVDSPLEY